MVINNFGDSQAMRSIAIVFFSQLIHRNHFVFNPFEFIILTLFIDDFFSLFFSLVCFGFFLVLCKAIQFSAMLDEARNARDIPIFLFSYFYFVDQYLIRYISHLIAVIVLLLPCFLCVFWTAIHSIYFSFVISAFSFFFISRDAQKYLRIAIMDLEKVNRTEQKLSMMVMVMMILTFTLYFIRSSNTFSKNVDVVP